MRPWTYIPRFFTNGANDQDVPNAQDRIAAQYVMTAGSWVSESRFGWNLVDLDRWDAFFRVMDPNPGAPAEVSAFARRVPFINITNLFSGPDAEIFNLCTTPELRPESQPCRRSSSLKLASAGCGRATS
jgi:hypothetical protein